MQAKIQDRAFNEESARSQFQLNPFQWHNHGRGHPMLVVTFWLARRDNREHEIFQTSRVDHLLKHGFSIPALRCPSDPLLWDKLCAVAEFETQKRKAPCIYLGLTFTYPNYMG